MKCNSHPHEYGPGVCTSCLRDRLLALISLTQHHHHHSPSSSTPSELSLNSSLQFNPEVSAEKNTSFSILSALFRPTRSKQPKRNFSGNLHFRPPNLSNSSPFHSRASGSESFSSSWISAFTWRRRRKTEKCGGSKDSIPTTAGSSAFSTSDFSVIERRRGECRGMSPEDNSEDEDRDVVPGLTVPAPTPMRRHYRSVASSGKGSRRSVSGFGACLNPLVRVGPQGRCRVGVSEIGIHGEFRNSLKFVGGGGGGGGPAVLGTNRSRKLADFGNGMFWLDCTAKIPQSLALFSTTKATEQRSFLFGSLRLESELLDRKPEVKVNREVVRGQNFNNL